MTNNWSDIGNASLVVVMGANPSENHPACMAHINAARAKGGKLVVIDPRKTRTAVQADRYIRIRPGTDIAFINGVVRGVIAEMEDTASGLGWIPVATRETVRTKFFAFLNQGDDTRTFFTDGDATGASTTVAVTDFSKYTDARLIVDGSDYARQTIGSGPTGISNFPQYASTIDGDPDTVYNWLKAHVDPYDSATVTDVCGCTADDLTYVVRAFIDNGRCSSVGAVTGANSQDPRVAGYKCTTMLYAMGLTQHTHGASNVKSFAVIQTLMGNVGRAGGGINALRGIHNVQGSTDMGNLQHLIPFYSGNPTAMSYIDASGNPDPTKNPANYKDSFGKYMDMLWGSPLNGTAGRTEMDMSYGDAYRPATQAGVPGLQQWGFFNMTYDFFGGGQTWKTAFTSGGYVDREKTDALYDLWPKTNGDNHITMFRKMAAGDITAAVVWGQNPAVTEPNQKWIREGFYQLDTLVVTELYETETAAVSRKSDGVTYLLPTCSHVEEAGSVSNSGRVLQWRERASKPRGNSKSDLELLFRFAKALNDADAFTHITDVWDGFGGAYVGLDAFQVLYVDPFNDAPFGGGAGTWNGDLDTFEDVSATMEVWRGAETAPKNVTVYGTEVFCDLLFRRLCTLNTGTSWLYTDAYNTSKGSGRLPAAPYTAPGDGGLQIEWRVNNRAKSRDTRDPVATLAYPAWGYSWLVNRRVLYNNGDVPGDQLDGYQRPEKLAALFATTNATNGRALNYSNSYRFYHRLADKPDVTSSKHVLPGRFPAHTEPYETLRGDLLSTFGRNTKGGPKWDLVPSDTTVWVPLASEAGGSKTNTTPAGIVTAASNEGLPDIAQPLVMTSIRCVEHFQGGPITRNNPWNVEAEPEPWVEINSFDAAARGIKDGDYINIYTVRSDSFESGIARPAVRMTGSKESGTWNKGYIARVGVGLQSNQRVGRGVVAIPWHWGDKGLSTGARANDLCIDASDANTAIPEYKACVCWITKA